MNLTREEAQHLAYGDRVDGWEEVEGTRKIVDHTRWSVVSSAVFLHVESGKFYMLQWSEGATEMQDQSPFDWADPNPIEVKPVEKTITVYEKM